MHAPDSGFSWVIVICCAYIHFALFGLFRSAGVMYVAMLQNYDVSREEVSWPFALCAAVFQLVGPLASVLTHYVSQRKVCLLGSAIATIGIGSCYFADSVMWINVFFGLVHGLGFGFVVTVIPITLNQYFVKHKATAIGIAFSGGTVSSMIFPSVMEWLLENYTLKDSFLLLSGVVMNTLVASSLMREPPWLKKDTESKLIKDDQDTKCPAPFTCSVESNDKPLAVSLNEFREQIADSVSSKLEQTGVVDNKRYPYQVTDESQRHIFCADNGDPPEDLSFKNGALFESQAHEPETNRNVNRNGALNEIEVKEPLLLDDKKIIIVPKKNVELTEPPKEGNSIYHSIRGILKEPIFHLITFTMSIYFLAVHSFFMVIVDFAKDKGIPESKAIYIMTVFSLTDLFGRAGLGWVTDRNFISRKMMIALNLGALGILNQIYPLMNSLSGILAVSAFYGLAVGSSITLFFVLQAECLGMDRLVLVVGLISFINGILTLFRPGIIGLFRDVIGAYNWMFHIIGLVCLVFSVMWLVEHYRTKELIKRPPQGGKE